ncbi:MAG: hypothetical protein KF709_07245 [Gemmatimonadaceae bacterium]|nr:hypothetical protein [Gemmatimonadaceae bacterium]
MEHQYASDLLEIERLHLLRLGVWALLNVVTGTALLTLLQVRRLRSAMLQHFGIQTAAWGLLVLLIAGWSWQRLALRDLAGATQLDRLLWLNIGLDLGYLLVGLTLAACGWKLGRRLGLVGAGLGIAVQGIALAVLDLQLAGALVR